MRHPRNRHITYTERPARTYERFTVFYNNMKPPSKACCIIYHASLARPTRPISGKCTVLKPVPGSGSRAKCAQFRGSSDAKHVSSWFQPWATLWPTCHMLVPASLLQSVECSTECKNSIFHCTIGCNKYKSSLASGFQRRLWNRLQDVTSVHHHRTSLVETQTLHPASLTSQIPVSQSQLKHMAFSGVFQAAHECRLSLT